MDVKNIEETAATKMRSSSSKVLAYAAPIWN